MSDSTSEEPFHLSFAAKLDTVLRPCNGVGSDGRRYTDTSSFWLNHLGNTLESLEKARTQWYRRGAEYWEHDSIPPTIDGVLGGLGFVSSDELQESAEFIQRTKSIIPSFKCGRAADVGAGIGRVTAGLLGKQFTAVDVIEQSPKLIDAAKLYLGKECATTEIQYIAKGIQEWQPQKPNSTGTYDAIWLQWVLGYLIDQDLVDFLKRCAASLCPGGVIFVKENVTRTHKQAFWMDEADCSLIRSKEYFIEIFKAAGLCVKLQEPQKCWPSNLYPVHMFALVPIS